MGEVVAPSPTMLCKALILLPSPILHRHTLCLYGQVGLCAHQPCHTEVVCEFTEGQDGYWPPMRGALEREGRERAGQPCPNQLSSHHGHHSPGGAHSSYRTGAATFPSPGLPLSCSSSCSTLCESLINPAHNCSSQTGNSPLPPSRCTYGRARFSLRLCDYLTVGQGRDGQQPRTDYLSYLRL